jgi:hypothetical protein
LSADVRPVTPFPASSLMSGPADCRAQLAGARRLPPVLGLYALGSVIGLHRWPITKKNYRSERKMLSARRRRWGRRSHTNVVSGARRHLRLRCPPPRSLFARRRFFSGGWWRCRRFPTPLGAFLAWRRLLPWWDIFCAGRARWYLHFLLQKHIFYPFFRFRSDGGGFFSGSSSKQPN